MQPWRSDIEPMRERLQKRRNRLLNEFCKLPSNTQLAIEIKIIDDQIAKLTEDLRERRKLTRGRWTTPN